MIDLMPAVAPARFFCVRDICSAIEARGRAQCSMMERAQIVRSMQLVLRRASVVIRAIAETADAAGIDDGAPG
jgi:hypothetical protein